MVVQFLLFTKRVLAITSVAIALYVVLGCWIYGPWWYSWLFEGEFKNLQYTLDGIKYLFESRFSLVLAVFVAAFVAVILASTWSVRVFRILDRFGWLITFTAVWAVALAFAIVYHTYRPTGPDIFEQMTQINDRTFDQIRAVTSLPAVQTPIDFHYLDAKRIDALYSQLEPELVEKQRTVADSATGRAKVGIEAGPGNAEAGFEKGKASTSSYSRTDFSPERKCIVVMQFVVENNRARHYTTRDGWMSTETILQMIVKMQQDQLTAFRGRFFGSNVALVSPKGKEPPIHEEKKEIEERDRERAEDFLLSELQNLQGLVFLDSVFDTRPDGNDAAIVAEFSTKPHPVFFRVSVPKSVRSEMIGKATFRVFGDVTRSLSSDGYVDIRAIALY